MFIFSVFGMVMFKQVAIQPGFDDVHNFQTFVKTFVLLFQVSNRGAGFPIEMIPGPDSAPDPDFCSF